MMATTESTRLQMSYTYTTGKSGTMSFANIDPDATSVDIKVLSNAIIANKNIYKNQPAILKEAYKVTTTKESIDVS